VHDALNVVLYVLFGLCLAIVAGICVYLAYLTRRGRPWLKTTDPRPEARPPKAEPGN